MLRHASTPMGTFPSKPSQPQKVGTEGVETSPSRFVFACNHKEGEPSRVVFVWIVRLTEPRCFSCEATVCVPKLFFSLLSFQCPRPRSPCQERGLSCLVSVGVPRVRAVSLPDSKPSRVAQDFLMIPHVFQLGCATRRKQKRRHAHRHTALKTKTENVRAGSVSAPRTCPR